MGESSEMFDDVDPDVVECVWCPETEGLEPLEASMVGVGFKVTVALVCPECRPDFIHGCFYNPAMAAQMRQRVTELIIEAKGQNN